MLNYTKNDVVTIKCLRCDFHALIILFYDVSHDVKKQHYILLPYNKKHRIMKNQILLGTFACLFASVGNAQENKYETVTQEYRSEFIVSGGAGFSTVFAGEKSSYNLEPRPGYQATLGWTLLAKKGDIGFSTELQFDHRCLYQTSESGDHAWNGLPGISTNMTYNLTYLTLPLTAKLFIGKNREVIAQGGCYGSYLINESASGNAATVIDWSDIDFGFTASIGFRREIGKANAISFFARTNVGLISTSDPYNYMQLKASVNAGYCRYIGLRHKHDNYPTK